MAKCNLCPKRRAGGTLPLCVQTYPIGALTYEEPYDFSARRGKSYAERIALGRAHDVSQL